MEINLIVNPAGYQQTVAVRELAPATTYYLVPGSFVRMIKCCVSERSTFAPVDRDAYEALVIEQARHEYAHQRAK